MNIYFARSIRGNHSASDGVTYAAIVAQIKSSGHRPMFEIGSSVKMSQVATSDVYIYQRDIAWLKQCHGAVAEVTNASTGVGYEIAYARHVCEIPIFFCAAKESSVSAMITGSSDVFFYRGTVDLSAALETWLLALVHGDFEGN